FCREAFDVAQNDDLPLTVRKRRDCSLQKLAHLPRVRPRVGRFVGHLDRFCLPLVDRDHSFRFPGTAATALQTETPGNLVQPGRELRVTPELVEPAKCREQRLLPTFRIRTVA